MSGPRKRFTDTTPPKERLAVATAGVVAFAQSVLKDHIRDVDGLCVGCASDANNNAVIEFPCAAVKLARQVLEVLQ